MSRTAWMKISNQLLKNILRFPDEAVIVGAEMDYTYYQPDIRIRIECNELKEVQDGEIIPTIRPIYSRDVEADGREIITVIDWGYSDP